jgi:LmeA-like phospholipid-binding
VTETFESAAKGSRMISAVVAPAVQLWLRSQVEQIEHLQVEVEAGDRQILSGYIPQVRIAARQAVYQGLHLSQIQLFGQNIRVNLGQVIRGKPLQLLQPIPVEAKLRLDAADLNASLTAPLMMTAVADLLNQLVQADPSLVDVLGAQPQAEALENLQILLEAEQLTLGLCLRSQAGKMMPFALRTHLSLASPRQLRFDSPQWLTSLKAKRGFPLEGLEGFLIDFGPEVALTELSLAASQIVCQGYITIMPAII